MTATVYTVRELRASLKEALDAAKQGEQVQINRGADIFVLLMSDRKNLVSHESSTSPVSRGRQATFNHNRKPILKKGQAK